MEKKKSLLNIQQFMTLISVLLVCSPRLSCKGFVTVFWDCLPRYCLLCWSPKEDDEAGN